MEELHTISELFAQAVFLDFTSKRFGLKSCHNSVDPGLAGDLLEILQWASEREECGLSDGCCDIEKIKERINTL